MPAVEGALMRSGAEWEVCNFQIEHPLDAGGTGVALRRYPTRHKAKGEPRDCPLARIWWLREGKAVPFQQYADTAKAHPAYGIR